jgi:hypothetical protein
LELVSVDAADRFQSVTPQFIRDLEWPYLLELTYREDLASLTYHTLVQTPLGGEREVPVQKFYYLHQLTRRRNSKAYDQLAEVLLRLNHQRVEAMVLKGAALAQVVYPDPGLRPFSDIDILVRRRDAETAHALLNGLGYRLNYWGGAIDPPSSTDLRFRSARQYFHENRDYLSIDLYWQLGRYPYVVPLDYAALWERASRVTLGNVPARVLSPEDMVLHLSLEFILGVWYGVPEVKYLRDIAEVVHRQDVDWPSLSSQVRRSALASPLYFSCRLSRELLGADIPEGALNSVHPKAGWREELAVKRLEKHIWGPDSRQSTPFWWRSCVWLGQRAMATRSGGWLGWWCPLGSCGAEFREGWRGSFWGEGRVPQNTTVAAVLKLIPPSFAPPPSHPQ